MTMLDPADPRADIDRMAADGTIGASDASVLHNFVDFLADPTSRCPICLLGDHTSAVDCPEVTPADRAAVAATREQAPDNDYDIRAADRNARRRAP